MSTYERDPNTGNLNLIDGMRSVDDVKALMLEFCYPIGSIYISTKNVSPQTFLGGTWESRSGYMLRAATSGVTFDKANDTIDGGADSVTVSSVASHNHTQNAHSHSSREPWHNGSASGTTLYGIPWATNSSAMYDTSGNQTGTFSGVSVKNSTATNIANGSNYTVNTIPKYKNVYMWERTA